MYYFSYRAESSLTLTSCVHLNTKWTWENHPLSQFILVVILRTARGRIQIKNPKGYSLSLEQPEAPPSPQHTHTHAHTHTHTPHTYISVTSVKDLTRSSCSLQRKTKWRSISSGSLGRFSFTNESLSIAQSFTHVFWGTTSRWFKKKKIKGT